MLAYALTAASLDYLPNLLALALSVSVNMYQVRVQRNIQRFIQTEKPSESLLSNPSVTVVLKPSIKIQNNEAFFQFVVTLPIRNDSFEQPNNFKTLKTVE